MFDSVSAMVLHSSRQLPEVSMLDLVGRARCAVSRLVLVTCGRSLVDRPESKNKKASQQPN